MVLRRRPAHGRRAPRQPRCCRLSPAAALVSGLLTPPKMYMRPLLLAVLFVSVISARAALDLSPFPSEFDGEGIKYTQLSFKDGQRRVRYVPPQNWTWRGGS